MKFSQRLGITEVRKALQGRSLDQVTRNRLWSALAQSIPDPGPYVRGSTWPWQLYASIWSDHLTIPVDELPDYDFQVRNHLKAIFLDGDWYEVYDLLQFAINSDRHEQSPTLIFSVSRILEEEMAGFKLIEGEFVEITDESEVAAIEDALEATAEAFGNARDHLRTALRLLSDRQAPDYRNSVKESISAVEAVVQTLTGDPRAELGKAMRLLEQKAPVHGAFASALRSLYGYTSNADGIRHALTEEANLDAPTAKFMLVVCSAFVVYLIQQVDG